MLGALPSASKRGLLAMSVVLVMAAGLIWVGPVAMGGPNPPGNNGTVKLDRLEFDDHPNNQPHVGCTFQVDFYGFDAGDLYADVTFTVHPPTGPFVTVVPTLGDSVVFIGEDDNSGGGSIAGLDAQETYELDLSAYTPHPQQGWHVKLTVNADGSQGADTKHKVFWVSGCETPPTTTTTTMAPTTTTMAPTTTTMAPTTTTMAPTTTTSAPPTTTSTDPTTTSTSAVTTTSMQP